MDAKVLRRLSGRGSGSVATPADFLDLGSRAAVDQALSRLVRRGALRRVSRGVYGYPERSALLGELSPRPEEVARALARQGCQRLLASTPFHPLSPPSAPVQGRLQGPPAKSKFLAVGPPIIHCLLCPA